MPSSIRHLLLLFAQACALALLLALLDQADPAHPLFGAFISTLLALLLLGGLQLRARLAHKAARLSLQAGLQQAGIPLLLVDAGRQLIFANPAFMALDTANVDAQSLSAFGEAWQAALERHCAGALAHKQSTPEERLIKPGDGREAMLLRLNASEVKDARGRPCVLISAENLSAHNQTLSAVIEREHALRTRTQNYVQTLIDVIPQPVYVKDQDGRFVLVNQTFCARHNLSRAELIGEAKQVLHADILRAEEALHEDLRVMAGTPIFREEHLSSEGQDLYFIISKQSCENPEGQRVLVGTQMDITPWRSAEQAVKDALLRETERSERTQAFFQRLVDVLPFPVCIKDVYSRYVMVNEAFVKSRGRATREELLNRDAVEVARTTNTAEWKEVAASRARMSLDEDLQVLAGTPLRKEENLVADQYGVLHDRIITKTACADPEGNQVVVVCMFDITDQRNAQRELNLALEAETARRERTQAFIQRLLDLFPNPVYVKDEQSRYLLVNEAFVLDRGLPREEMINQAPLAVARAVLKNSQEKLPEAEKIARLACEEDQQVLAGQPILKEENLVHALSGGVVDRIISKAACEDPEGRQVIVGAMFNITEMREAQRQLSRSLEAETSRRERTEAFIQRLIDVIPSPVYVRDTEGRFSFVNDAFVLDRKMPRTAILENLAWGPSPGTQVEARVREEDARVVAGELIYKEEFVPHFDSGQDRYRIISKRACTDIEGHTVIVGTNFDVTAWRKAEQALQETLARETGRRERTQAFVQRLLDVLPYPVSIKNGASQYLIVNDAFAQSRGCSKEEIISRTPDQVLDLISPQDSEYRKVASEHARIGMEEDQAVLAGARIRKETSRVLGHSGKQRDLIVTKAACEDPEGERVIVVSLFDITELRETQRELNTSLENERGRSERIHSFVQRLIDVIPSPVYVRSTEGWFMFVNDAFVQERGRSREEILAKRAWVSAEAEARVRAEDAQVVGGEVIYKEEHTPHYDTGKERYRIISKRACADPEGKIAIVGTNFDITPWRMAERNVQQTLERETDLRERTTHFIQSLLDALPLPICVRDQQSRHIHVNAHFLQETGLQREAIIGHSLAEILSDSTRIKISAEEDQIVLSGQDFFEEKQDLGLSGQNFRDLLISKRRCLDVDQQPVIVAAHIDVTAQREAERQALALMNNEKSLRQRTQTYIQRLIDLLPHPFFVKDQESRYIMLNQAFLDELQLPKEAVLGKSTLEIAADPDRVRWIMDEDQAVLAGTEVLEERHETSVSGGNTWADRIVMKRRCLDVDGLPVIAVSHLDVSAHRTIERALTAAMEREADLREKMGVFLQNAINVLPQEFYVKDADSRVLMVNPIFLSRRGLSSPAEALGKTGPEIGWAFLERNPSLQADPAAMDKARQQLLRTWAEARTEDHQVLHGKLILKRVTRYLPDSAEPHVVIIAKSACLDGNGHPVIVCASYDLSDLEARTRDAAEAGPLPEGNLLS